MKKWCMISEQTELTNPALQWFKEWASMMGVSHDTVNRIHCHCPPANLLIGVEEVLIFNSKLAETDRPAALLQSIRQAAKFMLSESANVLTGDDWLFDEMYRTNYHRIWCERYTDGEATLFESDYLAVFGQAAGTTTQEQASRLIKQYFGG